MCQGWAESLSETFHWLLNSPVPMQRITCLQSSTAYQIMSNIQMESTCGVLPPLPLLEPFAPG